MCSIYYNKEPTTSYKANQHNQHYIHVYGKPENSFLKETRTSPVFDLSA